MKTKIVTVSLLMVLTLFFAINVAEASIIELTYDFATPVVEKELEDYDVISMGLPKTSNAGLPVLPFKPVTVLLPYGEELENVEIISGNKTFIGEGFIIEPGQAQIPSCFNGTITPTPPNSSIYSSSDVFSHELYCALPVQDMCGYKILFLNLYPVRYVPKPGEMWYYENMTVVVHTKEQGPKGGLDFYRGLPEDRARALEMVDNPEEITSYDIQKPKKAAQGTSVVDPSEDYDYVVVTTEALKSSGGTYTFQDLVSRKNQKGVKATIVTVEQIMNEPAYHCYGVYGDGCAIPEFNGTVAHIRNFINDSYQNWGIKYVLLGGDYDPVNLNEQIIPYRGFYGFVNSPPNFPEDDNIPSDLYFAALNGSWNSDLDDRWGEPGEADLLAEVFVGRAPVDSEQELTNFTMKTITYENTNAPYLKKALMVGEALNATLNIWGGDYKDEVKDGSTNNGYCTVGFPSYFDVETLYDRDWPENNWSKQEIKDRINIGTHIINNAQHGHTWSVLKLWTSPYFYNDIADLTNTDYFFGYAGQGCCVGAFDNYEHYYEIYYPHDSILEELVTSEHGAFAYIGSSRSTFYKLGTDSSTQRLDREFWDAVFGEGKLHLGEANQDSKWDNIGSIGAYDGALRWDYYAFNLLGDPETSLNVPAHDTDILIVDDDVSEKYEKYYMNALHANGYNWDCTSPPADASVLLQYPVVIWLTGNDWTNTLSGTDEGNLQTYLDSGGNLFISGQDIGVDIGHWSSFYTDYLHADYIHDDTNIYTLNGVSGDPIGDGLSIDISEGDGADNQRFPSEIAPYDGNASVVFNYVGDGCGAIKADTGTYKVVYFAFGFEAIDNVADRNMVMSRVMRWLEPELITTCDALQDMNINLAGNYYLGTDIDCSSTTGWNGGAGFVPVGTSSNAFTGTFDGRGHKITGLYIDRPSTDYEGLFGYTCSGSEIKDVGLEDVDVNGNEYVGGLVGQNRGTITDSYSTGSVSGGDSRVGGLVGRNYGGTVENCYSTADVSGWQIVGGLVGSNRKPDGGTMARILNSYSKGSVTGHTRVGGLAGQNYWDGEIINSYSHSNVSSDSYIGGLIGLVYGVTVINSYSTGQVTGSYEVGGLIGDKNGGTVTHSYWDIETSGQTTSEGGEGKTTAEMKQQATFVGWDFCNVWAIREDVSYPFFGLPDLGISDLHEGWISLSWKTYNLIYTVKNVGDVATPHECWTNFTEVNGHWPCSCVDPVPIPVLDVGESVTHTVGPVVYGDSDCVEVYADYNNTIVEKNE